MLAPPIGSGCELLHNLCSQAREGLTEKNGRKSRYSQADCDILRIAWARPKRDLHDPFLGPFVALRANFPRA
jgi:hypothetical protein